MIMRTILREALKTAFEKTYDKPFDFGSGFLEDINGSGCKLPCVWVCPLELVGKTGRSEGTKTYLGTVYLLESSEGLKPGQKDQRWDDMERAALGALSETVETLDAVVSFDKIKAVPNEGAYTGFNDLSLKVTFEVTTKYCEDRE